MRERYSRRISWPRLPWRAYDALIVAGFVVCGALASSGRSVPAVFGVIGALTLVYGSFIEPHRLTVRRYEIGPEGAKGRLKIVFLSDLHIGPYKGRAWIERVVLKANALKPDLILLGGDFLYDRSSDITGLEPFKRLTAPMGVFAINGNHDGYFGTEAVRAAFAAMGVPLLENRSAAVEGQGRRFAVVGIDDDWFGGADFSAAFAGVVPGDLPIVMLHNPDLAQFAARYRPALMVAGHTHGGQIRLPFLGSVSGMPHHLGRRYDRGLFFFPMSDAPGAAPAPLIIGQGLGESGPRARLFCPPQIVEVILRH
jgi:predicted MPP superfamily phosphohydrolase